MQVSYKERFENIKRITQKITSSLDIAAVLEEVRDEARVIFPDAKEACLVMFDKESKDYMRPLHCAVFNERINCRLCKMNRPAIREAIEKKTWVERSREEGTANFDGPVRELAFPLFEDERVLAVLDLITGIENPFSEKDIALLEDLSDLSTNVIRNAKRHWTISQQKMTADKILGHIEKFVPESVKKIVHKNPEAPEFEKKEKDVSVLFLDVGGYTRMSELLDKVKVNFIIERYFSSYLDCIYKSNGDINETAGDGLMIIFQDPDPVQNALQAVQAATGIHDRTLEINRELKGRFDPVVVNMGINSGTALLGMTRFQGSVGSRMTYTASGPMTNLAARIASTSKNGEILVGQETATRLTGRVTLEDLGKREFKNVDAPVRVHRLVIENRPEE
jgi:class 3 adenylate cyclase